MCDHFNGKRLLLFKSLQFLIYLQFLYNPNLNLLLAYVLSFDVYLSVVFFGFRNVQTQFDKFDIDYIFTVAFYSVSQDRSSLSFEKKGFLS